MKNYDTTLIEKHLKYQLYHLVKFISTGEDILPSNQQQIIEQTKFTYSPLGKAFEKQIKIIEDQGEKTNRCFKEFETKRTNKSNYI